ncbi:MAG: endolytic transglycosylase MltG [Candidatus Oleimicrobiaceae bacterium]
MRRVLACAAIVGGGSILAAVLGLLYLPQFWHRQEGPQQVVIARGMNVTQIAHLLHEEGVVTSSRGFLLATKLLRADASLKAGKYQLSPRSSYFRILDLLRKGKVSTEWVTIPEGADSWTVASIMARTLQADSAAFISLTRDTSLLKEFRIPASSLEGYLYPSTYQFYWGVAPETAIRTMLREFRRQVGDSVAARAEAMGMTLHQVVTLASIIEGEAMIDAERPLISAVYHNRLRLGMPLQADPTIQFLVPGRGRRLLKKDLTIDSPYNTYLHPGLPPGPVNNPGMASIVAAIRPAPVDYLYFVARGDGGHVFSRTLREHLRAKEHFDQIRRQVSRATAAH